ncbi:MAG: MBL fold metallo-hydrolase [bacterium]|nr:MBL fold metallo-hydrolase [bacterium]
MARAIILGSSAALSDAKHDYTHFLLQGEGGRAPVLIDCGSNPLPKLTRLNVGVNAIQDIILTHFHADHTAGYPNLATELWLLNRTAPLRVYGVDHCLTRVEEMMLAFAWDTMPLKFPIEYVRVADADNVPVMENDDFRIRAWQTKHFIPTIGLRIENKVTGKVLAYSCDTEPIPGIIELGRNADMLIHEAAGATLGHSSAAQAGQVATAAGAKALYLIHYQPPQYADTSGLVAEAQTTFTGFVSLCEDMDVITF